MDTDSITLDINSWKIRIDERSRKRMKLQIKLSKDEALAFKNFSNICQPEGVSDEDFLRTVFVAGVETINRQLSDLVQKYAQENAEELASEGITVIENEDGGVRLEATDVSGAGEIEGGVLHDDEVEKHVL